jgi:hypothetical protein
MWHHVKQHVKWICTDIVLACLILWLPFWWLYQTVNCKLHSFSVKMSSIVFIVINFTWKSTCFSYSIFLQKYIMVANGITWLYFDKMIDCFLMDYNVAIPKKLWRWGRTHSSSVSITIQKNQKYMLWCNASNF